MSLRVSLARLFGFGPGQERLGKLSIRHWVWILVGLSIALQVLLALILAQDFRQNAYDLGVSVQGFSNVGNGRFFWATPLYLKHHWVSLLNSHFSWVYFAGYPIYATFPGATTLFVVQAVPIALAAIPLEALASRASGSGKRGLLVAGIYLAWAPMYAGLPNSFHLEAFLPVLFFSLVLVWTRRQYVLGLALAVLTGFTLDVAPVLIFLISIVFLTYPLAAGLRMLRGTQVPPPPTPREGSPGTPDRAWGRLAWAARTAARSRTVWACLGLIAVSIAVFLAQQYLEANFTAWIGLSGASMHGARQFSISIAHVSVSFEQKLEFWLLLGATVGFLPLLYPRILVVLVPWMGYTFLQVSPGWYTLPSQYVAIAAVPLFLGMALGIGVLPPRTRDVVLSSVLAPTPAPSTRRAGSSLVLVGSGEVDHHRVRRPSRGYVGSVVLVAALFALNVGINPMNPLTSDAVAASHNPLFTGVGTASTDPYGVALHPPPGYYSLLKLVSRIPRRASLLFQDLLYPLVGGDPNAYQSIPNVKSPFSDSDLPEYVLSSEASLASFDRMVSGLSTKVWNNSLYGVVGWVQSSPLSSVFLFEEGYRGIPTNYGPTTYPSASFAAGSTLLPGPASTLGAAPDAGGTVAAILSGGNRTGVMWTALDSDRALPSGDYELELKLLIDGTAGACSSTAGSSTLLDVAGFVPGAPDVYGGSILASEATCGEWVSLSLSVDLMYPVAELEFSGTRPTPRIGLSIDISSVKLVAEDPPGP